MRVSFGPPSLECVEQLGSAGLQIDEHLGQENDLVARNNAVFERLAHGGAEFGRLDYEGIGVTAKIGAVLIRRQSFEPIAKRGGDDAQNHWVTGDLVDLDGVGECDAVAGVDVGKALNLAFADTGQFSGGFLPPKNCDLALECGLDRDVVHDCSPARGESDDSFPFRREAVSEMISRDREGAAMKERTRCSVSGQMRPPFWRRSTSRPFRTARIPKR
jgi:hypothetical protein